MLLLYSICLALLPSFSAAFTFNFTDTPRQCQNLSISIDGAGQPPYSVVLIPFGASPLPNNIEARKIFQQQFSGSSTSVSFPLNYPENSQFVAVVSCQFPLGFCNMREFRPGVEFLGNFA